MAIIKPFKAYRPVKEKVLSIASRPYDVLSAEEAKEEAKGNPDSFYHIIKPEIDFPEGTDVYSDAIYAKGKANLLEAIAKGVFIQEEKPCYYIYSQTMWGKTQYGLVGGASVEDYLDNIIRKHELTRPDKEEDRKKHVRVSGFNYEPVFFTYPDNSTIDKIVDKYITGNAIYDFTTEDDITHKVWVIDNDADIKTIEQTFQKEVPLTYVADGHHRTAAAALVGEERKEANANHTGNEEYNFFLAVHFPASQLRIIDYNRVVKDLNGLSKAELIEKLAQKFEVENMGADIYKPSKVHEMSMYIDGEWFKLLAKAATYNDSDPIGCLDVTVLSNSVLEPLLDIKDLRKSKRIDFVGGIRGLGELKKRVDSGEMAVAFALFPVSMQQLINIADTGNIMPPKTTWFEPKLRSGLILHSLDD